METINSSQLDAKNLAQYSYVTAFITAAILLLVLVIGLLPFDALRMYSHVMWLALPSSAIGLALALMAQMDFKQRDPGAEWWNRMRVGLRINAMALMVMLMLMLIAVGLPFIMSIASPPIPGI